MFQFRRFPSVHYVFMYGSKPLPASGFPHSEIHGYNAHLQLPVAYRSLSRPSSAPIDQAFTLCSFQLDLFFGPQVLWLFRNFHLNQFIVIVGSFSRSLASINTHSLKIRVIQFSRYNRYCPLEPYLWWAQVDSNYRPHAYQACALTT